MFHLVETIDKKHHQLSEGFTYLSQRDYQRQSLKVFAAYTTHVTVQADTNMDQAQSIERITTHFMNISHQNGAVRRYVRSIDFTRFIQVKKKEF